MTHVLLEPSKHPGHTRARYARSAPLAGCLSASGQAWHCSVPLFRRAHYDLTTGIQVMNTGNVSATVRIDFVATANDSDDTRPITGCDVCSRVLGPMQGHDWWPGGIAAIPDFTFGAATITSDQPVVVLVNDYPLRAQSDPATYLGLPAVGD